MARISPGKLKRLPLFERFLVAGIVFEIAYAFFRALIRPIESYDSVAIHALKAKMFYLARTIPEGLFRGDLTFLANPDYPLLIPFSETSLYICLGELNDLLVKTIFPIFFLGLIVVFYLFLRRYCPRRESLLFTFLLASIPQVNNYATIGYCDLPLAFYCSISFFYMMLGLETKDVRFLILSLVLSCFGIWAKNEGLMYLGVNSIVAFSFLLGERRIIEKRSIYAVVSYICVAVLICISYLVARAKFQLTSQVVNLAGISQLSFMGTLKRIPVILNEYQKHFFGPKKWNLVWVYFIIAYLLNFKKTCAKPFRYLGISIITIFAGYTFVYLVTPLHLAWNLSTTASRFFIHFTPIVVFWIALLYRDLHLEI